MANFCTNCGAKIRKDDNFCTNCGTKLKKEGNFCTNCGTKIRKDDNFCINCGAKIDKSNIKPKKHILKSVNESIEKEKEEEKKKRLKIDEIFESEGIKSEIRKNNISQIDVISIKDRLIDKIINKKEKMSEGEIKYFIKTELEKIRNEKDRTAKEKEEEEKKKRLKIDEIFESEGIKSEIRKNNISQIDVISIKDRLIDKIINKKEKMSEGEIKYFIKTELEKIRIEKEKEMPSEIIENNEIFQGNYCSLSCRHCYEEFLDSGGGIVGDFDSEGCVEYYCQLGHRVSFGSFCEDYK